MSTSVGVPPECAARLWNINRSLWLAEHLKQVHPEVFTIFGGPEITADNGWVLKSPAFDFASIGETEQTVSELLAALIDARLPQVGINQLYVAEGALKTVAVREAASQTALPLTANRSGPEHWGDGSRLL